LQSIWAGESSVTDAVASICEQVDAFLATNEYPK